MTGRTAHTRFTIGLAVALVAVLIAAVPASAPAAAQEDELAIALDLATMLRSARSVIADNQGLINDPNKGNKGLTGPVVLTKALENFRKTKGKIPDDIDTASLHGRLLKAQMAAIEQVMNENQRAINTKGQGFKGFVPAVFARLVNEEFRSKMGEIAEVKVTAPRVLIRNRKVRPDEWEHEIIQKKLLAADWPRGKMFSDVAPNRGRKAFRVLVPEYYGAGCLACHGEPKGELDVTGYPKEGGHLDDLGGVISVTLYRK